MYLKESFKGSLSLSLASECVTHNQYVNPRHVCVDFPRVTHAGLWRDIGLMAMLPAQYVV